MSFCAQCGTKVEEGVHFCPHCGAAIGKKAPEEKPAPERSSQPSAAVRASASSSAPSSGNKKVWIIAGVGCGALALFGLIFTVVILFVLADSVDEPTPPRLVESSSTPTASNPGSGDELKRRYREVSYPNDLLVVTIPENWQATRENSGAFRFVPSPGDPEANRAWAEVRPFPNRKELSRDEIANAITASVRELSDLEILNFFPMETRVGGELVTADNPKKEGEITLTSYLMEIQYTDETTGRPFRGYSIVSTQSSDRGRRHYFIAFRCDVDLWEDYKEVFTQLLGYLQIGITPE